MPLPDEMRDLVDAALASVAENERHDLTLGWRHLLWSAMGPRDRAFADAAHRRRASLAILAVRKVAPIWHRLRPEDEFVDNVLRDAERVLAGDLDPEEARDRAGDLWVDMDDLAADGDLNPAAVGYAAIGALLAAARDEMFDPDTVDISLTDADVDAYETDAAFAAAAAYAGGPPWDSDADAEARREYWTWWLTEALPQAWDQGWA